MKRKKHKTKDGRFIHKCMFCKTKREYSEEFDSYYCPKCLYWLEKICPDRSCEFCKNKPKYPKIKPPKNNTQP